MYNPAIHHRRSVRLRGYDYSAPGEYYVTICVEGYNRLLGRVELGQMIQNEAARRVEQAWERIPRRFPATELDEHIVMPNHFHGILRITEGAPVVGPESGDKQGAHKGRPYAGNPSLGEMVGAFKSITTDGYIRGVREEGWPRFDQEFWQRSFYEHIIRNEVELERIREYIRRNPLMWAVDRYNPERGFPVVDEEGRVVPWEES
jgi:REP element-mobilizing transposase RayT